MDLTFWPRNRAPLRPGGEVRQKCARPRRLIDRCKHKDRQNHPIRPGELKFLLQLTVLTKTAKGIFCLEQAWPKTTASDLRLQRACFSMFASHGLSLLSVSGS